MNLKKNEQHEPHNIMSETCYNMSVFSGTPVSSTIKTDRHDIILMFLKWR
jgi:hypothetical protein